MNSVKRLVVLSVGLVVILGGGGYVTEAKDKDSDKGKNSLRVSDLSTVRGVVKPVMEVVISSELQAKIKKMPFRDGEQFQKGDLLVDFQCGKYVADLQAAEAEVESRTITLTHHEELGKLNGIGQLEIDVARSELKKAQASERVAQVMIGRCRITAPFDGRVVKALVNPYESVNPYDELLSILNDQHFDIELIVPSLDVQWLKTGSPFVFLSMN
ncbi:MAG: HlyD family efflux transporter periplasmic adaptor subunit [Nitrospirales bacterium]|nr:HlyD family efflux transporter periplasmic adaptor subunit [Nitrospirales bacterium]